jgi:signal transduction histidine kinase
MTLRTRILLWLLPAITVLAVGQVWLLRSIVPRVETDSRSSVSTVAQNSNNPAGQIGVPIPNQGAPREFNNSLPPPATDAVKPNSSAEKAQNQPSVTSPISSNATAKTAITGSSRPQVPAPPVPTKPITRAEQNAPTVQPPPATTPTPPAELSNPPTVQSAPRPVAPKPTPIQRPSQPTVSRYAPATPPVNAPIVQPEVPANTDLAQAEPTVTDSASNQISELEQLAKDGSVLVRQRNGNLEFEAVSNPSNWILLASIGVLVLSLLLGAFGVRRSLMPLYTLAAEIERRNASSLELIATPPLPELRPAVNALNRLLADMGETLERLKTQEASARRFAYNASHELRNPLTAARNYLEVLERHPTRTEATQGALGALDRTERILSSLLQLARLEGQGTPKRERIDLSSFLEAHFDVPVQGSGEVWAERDLLELSLENLVNNASNHAGGAKNIRVEARVDGTWLWVEDTGPGFNAELLPKAFEPFAKHGAGTGLGLAIVEAVARVHGGTVRAENRIEGGARVGLSIPAYFV